MARNRTTEERGSGSGTRASKIGALLILLLSGCLMPAAQYEAALAPVVLVSEEERRLSVLAAGDWRDTGVGMRPGETYEVVAEGKWQAGPHCNATDANGFGEETILCFRSPLVMVPVQHANFSTLIGKVGILGTPFVVGSKLALTAPAEGTLFLRMNDAPGFLGDNTGQLEVAVRRQRQRTIVTAAAPPEPRQAAPAPAPTAARLVPPPRAADVSKLDFGRFYALVIGNDNYAHLPKLKTAVADARAVANTLTTDYGFAVTTLLDATRSQIVDTLDEFRETLRENDNLLIYYAGHGWLDEDAQRGYWLPVDSHSSRRSNWLENTTVTDTLKTLRAKHVMVVADSCYSGTLTRSAVVGPRDADYLARIAKKRARVALTSGGREPVADTVGSGHSPFAQAFLETLKQNPGVMDGTTLFSHMRRPVMLAANQTPEYTDVRNAGHDGGDFLFVRKR